MVDQNILNVVYAWLKKADSDLKTIENNISAEDIPTDTICFHAQQAIEKYIKGALVYFGEQVTKTHDLVSLATAITPYIPEIGELENILDEVSHYGVEVRYPDLMYDPTLEEAKNAYNLALKVKKIVLAKLS